MSVPNSGGPRSTKLAPSDVLASFALIALIIALGVGWSKQNAVKSIRSKIGHGKDGLPDPSATRDTVEIHAHFTDAMVADTVQIITSSTSDDEVREISMRAVHGKYLIRLLEKGAGSDAGRILPHGTIVRLKFRQSAKTFDVIAAMKQWIILPGCEVVVSVAGAEPIRIGFATATEAIQAVLDAGVASISSEANQVKIVEVNLDGYTIAYAIKYSKIFREWSLVQLPDSRESRPDAYVVVDRAIRPRSGWSRSREVVTLRGVSG